MMPSENLNTICFGTAAIVAPAFGLVETTFECAAKPASNRAAEIAKAIGTSTLRLSADGLELFSIDFTLNFTAILLIEGESDPA
jgi:hypothetical protein